MAPVISTTSASTLHRRSTSISVPRTKKTVDSLHSVAGTATAGTLGAIGALVQMLGLPTLQTLLLRRQQILRTQTLAILGHLVAIRRTRRRPLHPASILGTSGPLTKTEKRTR